MIRILKSEIKFENTSEIIRKGKSSERIIESTMVDKLKIFY